MNWYTIDLVMVFDLTRLKTNLQLCENPRGHDPIFNLPETPYSKSIRWFVWIPLLRMYTKHKISPNFKENVTNELRITLSVICINFFLIDELSHSVICIIFLFEIFKFSFNSIHTLAQSISLYWITHLLQ